MILTQRFPEDTRFFNILNVVKILLDVCSAEDGRPLHTAIDSVDARRAKNLIRAAARAALRYPNTTSIVGVDQPVIKFLEAFFSSDQNARDWTSRIDESLREVDVSAEVIQEVATYLNLLTSECTGFPFEDALVARALALAIDDACHAQFPIAFEVMYGRGVIPLEPGMPLPSATVMPLAVAPAYRTDRTDDRADRLPNLRLVPQLGIPVSLVVDPSSWGYRTLQRITEAEQKTRTFKSRERRIGIACLGPCDSSFQKSHQLERDQQYSFQLDETPPELHGSREPRGVKTFHSVFYRDQEKALELIELASRENVDLLLFPELTFDERGENRVRDFVLKHKFPKLVVAGSRHVNDGAGRRNELRVFAAGDPELQAPHGTSLRHTKIGTFHFQDNDDYIAFEDVHRGQELKVYLCGGQLTTFAICKDLLTSRVGEAITPLGIRNLFTVAMSPKTDEFLHRMRAYTATSQTHAWLACASPANQITAAATVPSRNATVVEIRNRRKAKSGNKKRHKSLGFVDKPSLVVLHYPVPLSLPSRPPRAKYFEIHRETR